MAITATIAVDNATKVVNQNIAVALTVSNSGGANVNVLSVVPNAITTGQAASIPPSDAVGQPSIIVGSSSHVVPAGGSLQINWGAVFFAPSTGYAGTGSGTYSLGAIVYSDDGSVVSPTPVVVTVNPIVLG